MNPLDWLNPGRWLIVLGLVAALAFGVPLMVSRHDASQQDIGYQRRATEDAATSAAQTTRNLELQRAAEKRYTVRTEVREQFFDTAAREVHDASAPLAACLVPDAVRVRLNAAAACARGDPGSPDCAADPMPDAR